MKILVTGASGFIGSHLVEFLRQAGHEVLLVSRNLGIKTLKCKMAGGRFINPGTNV